MLLFTADFCVHTVHCAVWTKANQIIFVVVQMDSPIMVGVQLVLYVFLQIGVEAGSVWMCIGVSKMAWRLIPHIMYRNSAAALRWTGRDNWCRIWCAMTEMLLETEAASSTVSYYALLLCVLIS